MKYERVYISGKITGDPDYQEKFRKATEELVARGWNRWYVVNPAKECKQTWPWWLCMAKDLWLLKGCQTVAMLPDWNESRGAQMEHRWAQRLKKEIIYLY